jgi:hypothetical protein
MKDEIRVVTSTRLTPDELAKEYSELNYSTALRKYFDSMGIGGMTWNSGLKAQLTKNDAFYESHRP